MLDKYDIHHVYSTPYHPQSNGAVERTNRTVIQLLRGLVDSASSWTEKLSQMVLTYNHTWHSSINMSPSQCLLSVGYSGANKPWVDRDVSRQWQEGHPQFSPFRINDLVMKWERMVGHLASNKLSRRYEGPFRVVKVHENKVAYELEQGAVITRAHYTQLKPYIPSPKYLQKYNLEPAVPHEKADNGTGGCFEPGGTETLGEQLSHTPDLRDVFDTSDDSSGSDFSGFYDEKMTSMRNNAAVSLVISEGELVSPDMLGAGTGSASPNMALVPLNEWKLMSSVKTLLLGSDCPCSSPGERAPNSLESCPSSCQYVVTSSSLSIVTVSPPVTAISELTQVVPIGSETLDFVGQSLETVPVSYSRSGGW